MAHLSRFSPKMTRDVLMEIITQFHKISWSWLQKNRNCQIKIDTRVPKKAQFKHERV
jgi:hypothetical protein